MKFKAYKYQDTAIRYVIDHDKCALFLDMGLGKTVITLTALSQLILDGDSVKCLVVAPKKVAESTWSGEANKWSHLNWLRVSPILGDLRKRKAAIITDADIYVISRDNFAWLVEQYDKTPFLFDTLVLDELTSFKTPKSKRFKAAKLIRGAVNHIIGLTGTPAPNGLKDLWGQIYLLDGGERLEKTLGKYHDKYFDLYRRGAMLIRCEVKKGYDKIIYDKIRDISLSMMAKDYLELPRMIEITERINLTDKQMSKYNDFERNSVLDFIANNSDDDGVVYASSAAALANKLSQYANGAVYDDNHNAVTVHDEKLDKLKEIIESANNESVLVFYQYQHDADRIEEAISGCVRYKDDKTLAAWNNKEIKVLLSHPASTAYGLNMQYGGRIIVWFGVGWNLELYQQGNARLYRQGQTKPVMIYRLIVNNTIDEDELRAIANKSYKQNAMLDSIKSRINIYT